MSSASSEREAPVVLVQLMRADTQVQEGAVQPFGSHHRVAGGLVETAVDETDSRSELLQLSAGRLKGRRIAVYRQHAARGTDFQKPAAVSSATDGTVQEEPVSRGSQELENHIRKDGFVVATYVGLARWLPRGGPGPTLARALRGARHENSLWEC